MNTAQLAVFIDFDGTITTADTGVHLLDKLAPDRWREIETEYKAGRIGSRECMARQWALLPTDRAAIEAAVRAVPIDPGIGPLVDLLRGAGAEITVVSDGYGFRAQEVAAALDVPVLTNGIDWEANVVLFPASSDQCPCAQCGTCKRVPVEDAKARGKLTVLIGDAMSDVRAAAVAHVVFAKGELAQWCDAAFVILAGRLSRACTIF